MSITHTQKEPLNYIHPLVPKAVNFGVNTFLVNVKVANEEGIPNGDALPDMTIAQLDAWQAKTQ